MLRSLVLITLLSLTAAPAHAEGGATLHGSRASMLRQNEIARRNDYSFLRTGAQVREFVEEGRLVPLAGNADYEVDDGVSYPYARPELRTFVERLSAQHREACGERLVVTSLTRPTSGQPRNSHALSVHPTGMAVDLRVARDAGCRDWLQEALLSLEGQGLLDVTREYNPPHFHVAVFPDAYREYAAARVAEEAREAAAREAARRAAAAPPPAAAGFVAAPPRGAEPPAGGPGWEWLLFGAAALGLAAVRARNGSRRR